MKKITLAVFNLFFTLQTFSQIPVWQWARSGGGTGVDVGYSISTDPAGNVFVAGTFDNSPITFGNITLFGGPGIFVVK